MTKHNKKQPEESHGTHEINIDIKPYTPMIKDDEIGHIMVKAVKSTDVAEQIGNLTLAVLSLRDAVMKNGADQSLLATLFNNNVMGGLQAVVPAVQNMSYEATATRAVMSGGEVNNETQTIILPAAKKEKKDDKPHQHGHYL